MNREFVDYQVVDQVARVTLNRPDFRNAQSRRLLEELDQVLAEAAADREVHVIALFGAGDHFSAGHDLGTAQERKDRDQRPLQQGLRGRFEHSRENFVDRTLRWRNLPKPTIAGVHGYCIYAGWMIASAMDIIYAADNAMFLGANFQYFSIPWDLHPRKAKELLYESRFIDAWEAHKLELVNRVYPAAELDAAVMAYAQRVARNDPFQLRMIKQAVNQVQDGQGFAAHITSAHTMHMLSSEGEKDPDYALKVPKGARRPMVQRAFENYELNRQAREGGADTNDAATDNE
jgi:enoyl-CoA hydratase